MVGRHWEKWVRWAVSVGATSCGGTRPCLPGFADPAGLCIWKKVLGAGGGELECSGAWPHKSSPESKGASSV